MVVTLDWYDAVYEPLLSKIDRPGSWRMALFESVKARKPLRADLQLADLLALIVRPWQAKSKAAIELWSPTVYKSGATRGIAGVESLTMLLLDVDDGTAIADLLACFPGLLVLAHTSYSHTPSAERWRLLLPLASPVAKADWVHVWRWASKRCPAVDRATKDASRIYYQPATPVDLHRYSAELIGDGTSYQVRVQAGDLLDVTEVVEAGRERAKAERWQRLKPVRCPGVVSTSPGPPEPRERFAAAVLRTRVGKIKACEPGGGRNVLLYGAAADCSRLAISGAMRWTDAEAALMDAAKASGLTGSKARRPIERGRAAGEAQGEWEWNN